MGRIGDKYSKYMGGPGKEISYQHDSAKIIFSSPVLLSSHSISITNYVDINNQNQVTPRAAHILVFG